MWALIARSEMCSRAVIRERCGCGEKRIELGHNLREGDVLHRIGVPCYNIEEHHAIPNSTEKD
jgi:hypothetical protein